MEFEKQIKAEENGKVAKPRKEGEIADDELDNVSGGCGEEPKAPEEYTVKAGWKPVCDGQFVRANGRANVGLSEYCCGMCKHFGFNGYLDVFKEGVCRREFKS